ncbi:MAG: DUF1501 domain-containing protein [Gemmataceae bacterium]|nr:DUF1501 domain-containing protein [Gemmataceae bacterium]
MVTSPETRRAFDLSREPAAVRDRYGTDPGSDRGIEARKFGGLPHIGQTFLLARRLVEAGVRLVTVMTGRRIDQAWDTHRDHFGLMRRSLCPPFDRALSALLEDLHQRGLLDETLVVVMGEFGRTPRIGTVTSNAGAAKDNGRDHWPYCYTVLFAGGGVSGGPSSGRATRRPPIRGSCRSGRRTSSPRSTRPSASTSGWRCGTARAGRTPSAPAGRSARSWANSTGRGGGRPAGPVS